MSIKTNIFKVITKLPNGLNNLLLKANVAPGIVYGKAYSDYLIQLKHKQITAADSQNQLLKIANHAIRTVPHYRDKYEGTELTCIEDYESTFEFIDKNQVMQCWESFVQQNIDHKKYVTGFTGGTSGKPMKMLIPKERHVVELGSIHSLWAAFGFRHHPRAVLRGTRVPGTYIINPITKEYIFDGFDLTDKAFTLLSSVMKKKGIKYLHCYPSSGYEFAKFLQKNEPDPTFIKAFFVSSENVLSYQRELVQSLGIGYSMHYGHSEKLVLAANCPTTNYYHVLQNYGYLELVDESNNVIREPDVVGEIVGSTINNYGFPLLRYKTGDFAEYIHTDCACGYNGLSLRNVYGRWEAGKIYNKDGSFVTTTALNLHSDLYDVIDGLQYVQNSMGELIVDIVPGCGFDQRHEQRFLEHFKSALNPGSVIEIRKVDKVRRQDNGKFLLLLSNLEQ